MRCMIIQWWMAVNLVLRDVHFNLYSIVYARLKMCTPLHGMICKHKVILLIDMYVAFCYLYWCSLLCSSYWNPCLQHAVTLDLLFLCATFFSLGCRTPRLVVGSLPTVPGHKPPLGTPVGASSCAEQPFGTQGTPPPRPAL